MRARHFQSLTGTCNCSWLRLSFHFFAECGWIIGFLGLRHHGNQRVRAAESDNYNTKLLCGFRKTRVSLTQFTHFNKWANNTYSLSRDYLLSVDVISSTWRVHTTRTISLAQKTENQRILRAEKLQKILLLINL